MGYSPNSSFFFSKTKNKIKTSVLAKASLENFTCRKNQAVILDGIGRLIIPHFTQN
jgi:hypothetical protein